jgi:hypothetical protein
VRPDFRERWLLESAERTQPLKNPRDLLSRPVSSEDYVDSVLIGGMSLKDIIAGKVDEWQIPADVIRAWKLAYPRQSVNGTFLDAVAKHSGDPDTLRGVVSGVKGKLFEINYVDYLNAGHLPSGYTAKLADSATQPGWDIRVLDDHGAVVEQFQNKASECASYVRAAIHADPSIPSVVPRDVFLKLSERPDFVGHLVDGQRTLGELHSEVNSAVEHAGAAALHFHLPVVAVAFTIAQNCSRYRKGSCTLQEAMANIGTRSLLATIASAAGWGASAAAHASIVGVPVAMVVRLFGSQAIHNVGRRRLLTSYVQTVAASRIALKAAISSREAVA